MMLNHLMMEEEIIPNHSLGNDFALHLPAILKPILLIKQVVQVSRQCLAANQK